MYLNEGTFTYYSHACTGTRKGPKVINLTLKMASGSISTEDSGQHDDSSSYTSQAKKKKKHFHRELRYMMHGFGDDPNPYNETVDMVDDLVVEFITEMTVKAMDIGKKGKIHVEDILYLTRKDPKKHARVQDLLLMNEELKKAKRIFETTQEDI